MQDGILAKAQELGIKVDIFSANSEEDVQGQLDILENVINKGTYKAIGVAPLSPDNLNNAIAEATKKGIYVTNIDEKVNLEGLKGLGGSVFAFVTTDNKAVGAKGASAIIDALKDGGKVAIIEGKAGNVSGEDRKVGAESAFQAAAGIELVESQPADWDRTKALDVATNYLQKHPDLKAIYCCNDTMAMGALQAVINANKLGEVLVVGTDGNDDAVESVKAGELYATVAQDPAGIGAKSLELLVKILNEKPAFTADVTPEAQFVESTLIMK
jgi:D-allose transport system substrate-binding protein